MQTQAQVNSYKRLVASSRKALRAAYAAARSIAYEHALIANDETWHPESRAQSAIWAEQYKGYLSILEDMSYDEVTAAYIANKNQYKKATLPLAA